MDIQFCLVNLEVVFLYQVIRTHNDAECWHRRVNSRNR
jgi:hypothetical protein